MACSNPPIFFSEVVPTHDGVSEALKGVVMFLEDHGLHRSKVAEIELAMAEALNNVVEHSVGAIDVPDVSLRCELRGSGVKLSIADNGPPFTPPTAEDADRKADHSIAVAAEGGFGWHLIHSLASDVCFAALSKGNLLTLNFDLSPQQPKDFAS